MDIITRNLFNLFRVLHSETGSHQLAAGVCGGMILGLTPFFSLQSLLVFFAVLFFRVQLGAAMVSAFFFSIIAYLLDPLFDRVGHFFLAHPSLFSFWSSLYNLPLLPLTRFNHSVVLGSGIIALLLCPLVYFIALKMIAKYRQVVVTRFRASTFFKAVKGTKIYGLYQKWHNLYH